MTQVTIELIGSDGGVEPDDVAIDEDMGIAHVLFRTLADDFYHALMVDDEKVHSFVPGFRGGLVRFVVAPRTVLLDEH